MWARGEREAALTWFRLLMVLLIIACAVPLVSVALASALANAYGCTLHEGFANPCLINGEDWGKELYQMGMMGWFMLATLPLAAALLALWAGVELTRAIRNRGKA